jgi:hypothetical protein
MIVAIHQPQYLPWLSYFLKIEESDIFILLDTVSFQKNGLQNRNQIKTTKGRQWLTVPVKQSLGQEIKDVQIDNHRDWRRKHWHTICYSYGKSALFKHYQDRLEEIYEYDWTHLTELNIELMSLMLDWMGIRTKILRSSEMKASGVASELLLNLCLEAKATRYISGTGGCNYLSNDAFAWAGIEVVIKPPTIPYIYPQMFSELGFVDDLSALDIILNCGESWRNYLPLRGEG